MESAQRVRISYRDNRASMGKKENVERRKENGEWKKGEGRTE